MLTTACPTLHCYGGVKYVAKDRLHTVEIFNIEQPPKNSSNKTSYIIESPFNMPPYKSELTV